MKKSRHNINTGMLLDNYLRKHKIFKSALAENIGRNKISVLRYTQNNSIQTDILIDICYATKYNFFQDIADALPKDFARTEIIDIEKTAYEKEQLALIAELREENKILKVQNELLMRIKIQS